MLIDQRLLWIISSLPDTFLGSFPGLPEANIPYWQIVLDTAQFRPFPPPFENIRYQWHSSLYGLSPGWETVLLRRFAYGNFYLSLWALSAPPRIREYHMVFCLFHSLLAGEIIQ